MTTLCDDCGDAGCGSCADAIKDAIEGNRNYKYGWISEATTSEWTCSPLMPHVSTNERELVEYFARMLFASDPEVATFALEKAEVGYSPDSFDDKRYHRILTTMWDRHEGPEVEGFHTSWRERAETRALKLVKQIQFGSWWK